MNGEPVKGAEQVALCCRTCGRLVAITRDEIRAHGASGWLRCCGEVMSLEFTASDGVTDEP
jgi:hypothetical protein